MRNNVSGDQDTFHTNAEERSWKEGLAVGLAVGLALSPAPLQSNHTTVPRHMSRVTLKMM